MPPQRDPLSVRYDGVVRDLMMRAARASASRRGVQAWIASGRAEFRQLDRGGRTAHERAFIRSSYYLIWRVPINNGVAQEWSLKLTWGADADRKPSAQGKLARPVVIRLFPRGQARPGTERWVGTARQSTVGNRIDD
jgi:hypothetical protein